MSTLRSLRCLATAALVAVSPTLAAPAFADAKHGHGQGHGQGHGGNHPHDIGVPGKAAQASRTVEVVLYDNYYEPSTIEVKRGETVRFKIRNAGELVHEFNIATPALHHAHQEEMEMMVEHGVLHAFHIDHEAAQQMQASMGHAMHDEPNSVLLEPGEAGEVVWTFPKEGALEFACNVPGHYDAGMVGDVVLTD